MQFHSCIVTWLVTLTFIQPLKPQKYQEFRLCPLQVMYCYFLLTNWCYLSSKTQDTSIRKKSIAKSYQCSFFVHIVLVIVLNDI